MNKKLITLIVIVLIGLIITTTWTTISANSPVSTFASSDSSKFAFNTQSTSAQSSSNSADPVIAPSGVANVPVNTGFQWAAITKADSYEIQLSNNPNFSNPTDAKVTNTVWAPSQNLNFGTNYFWRFRGFSGSITSDWVSNTFTTRTQSAASTQFIPSYVGSATAPSGAADVPVNTGFQWAVITGASSYEIQLANNADFSNPVDAKVNDTIWAPSQNLNYGTTYFWRVKGFAGTVTSDWLSYTFTTMTQPATTVATPTANPTP